MVNLPTRRRDVDHCCVFRCKHQGSCVPAGDVVRAQANAYLVVPDLDRMIPVAAAPGRRAWDLVDVVHQDVDMIDFLANSLEETRNLSIITVVALDRTSLSTGSGDFTRCGVDRAFTVAPRFVQ